MSRVVRQGAGAPGFPLGLLTLPCINHAKCKCGAKRPGERRLSESPPRRTFAPPGAARAGRAAPTRRAGRLGFGGIASVWPASSPRQGRRGLAPSVAHEAGGSRRVGPRPWPWPSDDSPRPCRGRRPPAGVVTPAASQPLKLIPSLKTARLIPGVRVPGVCRQQVPMLGATIWTDNGHRDPRLVHPDPPRWSRRRASATRCTACKYATHSPRRLPNPSLFKNRCSLSPGAFPAWFLRLPRPQDHHAARPGDNQALETERDGFGPGSARRGGSRMF